MGGGSKNIGEESIEHEVSVNEDTVPSTPSKDIAENVTDQPLGDLVCPASMFDPNDQRIIDDPYFCGTATRVH